MQLKRSVRAGVFKSLCLLGFPILFRRYAAAQSCVYILTFHRISDRSCSMWPPMPVSMFSRIISYLASYANIIPPSDINRVSKSHSSAPNVVITFDDGYVDFFENALPVLRRHNVKCIHHICPGLIDKAELPWPQIVCLYMKQHPGKRFVFGDYVDFKIPLDPDERTFLGFLKLLSDLPRPIFDQLLVIMSRDVIPPDHLRLMGWDEIRQCSEQGVCFGSHSMVHENLARLDEDSLADDLLQSRLRIEEELSVSVQYFAFPSGYYSPLCSKSLKLAGYKAAFTSDETYYKNSFSSASGIPFYPRINIAGVSLCEEKLRIHGFHVMAAKLANIMSLRS